MIVLCALDWRDARLFAQDHGIPKRDIWYIGDIHYTRGIEPGHVAVTTGFALRKDAQEIWATLRSRARPSAKGHHLPAAPLPGIWWKE